MKSLLRETYASARLAIRGRRRMPTVLMYHSIGENQAHASVTPAMFRRQLDFLAKEGYEVVPLAECARRGLAGESGKIVALTFDDGYADFIATALPELQARKLPCMVFLITGRMGGTYVDSRGTVLPLMTWDDAKAAARLPGVEFGSHTASHPKLSLIPTEEAKAELILSRDHLAEAFGPAVRWLCYPHGRHSPEVVAAARGAGYAGAVTIEPRHPRPGDDLFLIPRRYVHSEMGLKEFEACLA